ncbi:hypothetical protein, partial [Bradyrhizobium sp. NBAIM08]|uniref:hypothetical protein n=1 Tax=Bradyrhizobium sp. NBAIM08 TaxID=2793815 RepID=UPI001CD2B44B
MAPYATGHRVKVFKPPVGNFFGIVAGRLTLNVAFTVAAMSGLDPDIAAAMAGQFFQGSDDALRYLIQSKPEEIAATMEVATAQREAAEGETRAAQEELYADRLRGTAAADRSLPLKVAWKRFHELQESTLDLFNRHLIV